MTSDSTNFVNLTVDFLQNATIESDDDVSSLSKNDDEFQIERGLSLDAVLQTIDGS